MLRIVDDPTRATCPSFEDPEWEFLRQNMLDANQGDPACYARTGRLSRLEVSWSGVGSVLSALATCDADMW